MLPSPVVCPDPGHGELALLPDGDLLTSLKQNKTHSEGKQYIFSKMLNINEKEYSNCMASLY